MPEYIDNSCVWRRRSIHNQTQQQSFLPTEPWQQQNLPADTLVRVSLGKKKHRKKEGRTDEKQTDQAAYVESSASAHARHITQTQNRRVVS